MAFWKIVGLDVCPRMPSSRSRASSPGREVAALQVVEPGALAELLVEADEAVHQDAPSMRALAWATTLSTLMPSLSSATGPGALAPNRSMPTDASAHVAQPKVAAASTDSAGNARRQHVAPVVVGLALEPVPRRHGHHPGGDAVGLEPGGGVEAHRHLAAGADEHDLRAVDVVDDGGAHLDGEPVGHDGHALAGEDERGGAVGLDGDAPRLGRLVGVGRADHLQLGHGPQRRQLLDRLVGGAVLTEADRVVGEDEDRPSRC